MVEQPGTRGETRGCNVPLTIRKEDEMFEELNRFIRNSDADISLWMIGGVVHCCVWSGRRADDEITVDEDTVEEALNRMEELVKEHSLD